MRGTTPMAHPGGEDPFPWHSRYRPSRRSRPVPAPECPSVSFFSNEMLAQVARLIGIRFRASTAERKPSGTPPARRRPLLRRRHRSGYSRRPRRRTGSGCGWASRGQRSRPARISASSRALGFAATLGRGSFPCPDGHDAARRKPKPRTRDERSISGTMSSPRGTPARGGWDRYVRRTPVISSRVLSSSAPSQDTSLLLLGGTGLRQVAGTGDKPCRFDPPNGIADGRLWESRQFCDHASRSASAE